jgi:hypothetical protein
MTMIRAADFLNDYELLPRVEGQKCDNPAKAFDNPFFFGRDPIVGIDYIWYEAKARNKTGGPELNVMIGKDHRRYSNQGYSASGYTVVCLRAFDAPIVRPPEMHSILLGVFSEFSEEYLKRLMAGKWEHGIKIHDKLWLPADIEQTDPRQIKQFADLVDRKREVARIHEHAPGTHAMLMDRLEEIKKLTRDNGYCTTWTVYDHYRDVLAKHMVEMPEKNNAEIMFYTLYVPLLKKCYETNNYTPMKQHVEMGKEYPILTSHGFNIPIKYRFNTRYKQ